MAHTRSSMNKSKKISGNQFDKLVYALQGECWKSLCKTEFGYEDTKVISANMKPYNEKSGEIIEEKNGFIQLDELTIKIVVKILIPQTVKEKFSEKKIISTATDKIKRAIKHTIKSKNEFNLLLQCKMELELLQKKFEPTVFEKFLFFIKKPELVNQTDLFLQEAIMYHDYCMSYSKASPDEKISMQLPIEKGEPSYVIGPLLWPELSEDHVDHYLYDIHYLNQKKLFLQVQQYTLLQSTLVVINICDEYDFLCAALDQNKEAFKIFLTHLSEQLIVCKNYNNQSIPKGEEYKTYKTMQTEIEDTLDRLANLCDSLDKMEEEHDIIRQRIKILCRVADPVSKFYGSLTADERGTELSQIEMGCVKHFEQLDRPIEESSSQEMKDEPFSQIISLFNKRNKYEKLLNEKLVLFNEALREISTKLQEKISLIREERKSSTAQHKAEKKIQLLNSSNSDDTISDNQMAIFTNTTPLKKENIPSITCTSRDIFFFNSNKKKNSMPEKNDSEEKNSNLEDFLDEMSKEKIQVTLFKNGKKEQSEIITLDSSNSIGYGMKLHYILTGIDDCIKNYTKEDKEDNLKNQFITTLSNHAGRLFLTLDCLGKPGIKRLNLQDSDFLYVAVKIRNEERLIMASDRRKKINNNHIYFPVIVLSHSGWEKFVHKNNKMVGIVNGLAQAKTEKLEIEAIKPSFTQKYHAYI